MNCCKVRHKNKSYYAYIRTKEIITFNLVVVLCTLFFLITGNSKFFLNFMWRRLQKCSFVCSLKDAPEHTSNLFNQFRKKVNHEVKSKYHLIRYLAKTATTITTTMIVNNWNIANEVGSVLRLFPIFLNGWNGL